LAAAVSPGYFVLWSLPLAGLLVSSFAKLVTRTSPEKLAQRRRRRAKSQAIKRLKTIASADSQQRQELLASTMKQYIGDRFDKVAGSLTADECYSIVISASNDEQVAEKYRDTIAKCETSRYAAAEADVGAAQVAEVVSLIRTIDKSAKK
jgi:hypothetical protein